MDDIDPICTGQEVLMCAGNGSPKFQSESESAKDHQRTDKGLTYAGQNSSNSRRTNPNWQRNDNGPNCTDKGLIGTDKEQTKE